MRMTFEFRGLCLRRHRGGKLVWIVASVLVFGLLPANTLAGTVDFEAPPVELGTIFGFTAGDLPGDQVFDQRGTLMSVDTFAPAPGSLFFGNATVGGAHSAFFDTTPLQLNNINVFFEFPTGTTQVSFEYIEFQGSINFSISPFEKRIFPDVTFLDQLSSVDGPNSLVVDVVPSTLSDTGVVTITAVTGTVDFILIGGQELSIDTINAVPEPASLVLLGLGAGALGRRRLRRRNRAT